MDREGNKLKTKIHLRTSLPVWVALLLLVTGTWCNAIVLAQAVQDKMRLNTLKERYSPSMPEALLEPNLAGDPHAVYLQFGHDPCRSLVLHWISPASAGIEQVYWRREGSGVSGWRALVPKRRDMTGTDVFKIYHAQITELEPDTYYEWRFSESGEVFKSRTMPEIGVNLNRSLKIGQGGDAFNWYKIAEKMNLVVAAQDPDLVIICGDIAQDNGEAENWKRWVLFLRLWQDTMRGPEDGRLIPLMPTIGNHEVGNGGSHRPPSDALFFYDVFAFPGEAGYGVLDFGDYLSIIWLDSAHTHPIEGEQTNFLEQALKARQDGRMLIAAHHLPLYPATRHPLNTENRIIRKYWEPLFDKYGLDIGLSGDEHTYKRTYPIKNGVVSQEGVIYLGDGGWGVIENRMPKQPGRFLLKDEYWYLAASSQQNYGLVITLRPEIVTGEKIASIGHRFIVSTAAYNWDGEVFDRFTFTVNEPVEGVPVGRKRLPEYELLGVLVFTLITLIVVLILRTIDRVKTKST